MASVKFAIDPPAASDATVLIVRMKNASTNPVR